jgi:hypothetical protein
MAESFDHFFISRPLERNETTKQMDSPDHESRRGIKFLIADCGTPSSSTIMLTSMEN